MVEAPGLYPYLTGRDNLRVLAHHARAPLARVDAVLGETGLSDRADDRARTYSMGMKQRLGVAAALLKDPELLILDEPTNGLDPAGMAEMRAFIRSLARGGRTVVLSSHLMGEVEQVSDRVGVIRDGALVAEGTWSSCAAAPRCACALNRWGRRRSCSPGCRRSPRSPPTARCSS